MSQIFEASIAKWFAQVGTELDGLARQSIQSLAKRVVEDTPVDTGFLRGSWQPSIGAPGSDDGAATDLGLVVAQLKTGDVLYYTNGAAYALRIENGFVGEDSLGRSYNQVGRHMVAKNIAAWDLIVGEAAAELGLAG